jgi:hypothetical protein
MFMAICLIGEIVSIEIFYLSVLRYSTCQYWDILLVSIEIFYLSILRYSTEQLVAIRGFWRRSSKWERLQHTDGQPPDTFPSEKLNWASNSGELNIYTGLQSSLKTSFSVRWKMVMKVLFLYFTKKSFKIPKG